ncbi:unnamed protein product [Rotaria sp. Silwood2]|nr:unnamed protein product [Rotaria sp. Silwood2]
MTSIKSSFVRRTSLCPPHERSDLPNASMVDGSSVAKSLTQHPRQRDQETANVQEQQNELAQQHDLDLLPMNETYCQTLTKALYSINNYKNVFIILLQTGPISSICKQNLENIITKFIQFNMLQRHHIRTCIQNEAYIQNVQPPFDNQEIENILNSLKYTNEQEILYSTTGCKQIPSLVMLESKKHRIDN